jgi:hypothetical protein
MLFAAKSWALWNLRNKLNIERKFIRHAANLIFLNCSSVALAAKRQT